MTDTALKMLIGLDDCGQSNLDNITADLCSGYSEVNSKYARRRADTRKCDSTIQKNVYILE
jgi:hypothetical protein